MRIILIVSLSVLFLSAHRLAAGEMLLDGFEANDWVTSQGKGSEIKTSLVPGKVGQALKVEFDLKGKEQWVAIHKDLSLQELEGKAIQFYLKASGEKINQLEVKLVDEDGTNYGHKLPVAPIGLWELVSINFSDFSYWWGGDPDLGQVKQIYFAISAGDGGKGEFILDELKIISSKEPLLQRMKSGVIDNFDSLSGWETVVDEGSNVKIASVLGLKGEALGIEYNLGSGNWVQFYKSFPLAVTEKSVFRFFFKWSGKENHLEFKLVDKDGSNFGKKLKNPGKKDKWHEIKIPVSDLSYWWGGDKELDMKNIQAIWLAVSRNKGGKGTVAIDQLELIE